MPTLHAWLAFSAAAFAIIVVPGPSVLFVISRGVALGKRAALATVLGNTTGAIVQAIAVAVGLGSIVARSTAVFTAVKIVGAAYLILIGAKMFRSRAALAGAIELAATPRTTKRIVREGFVVGVTNPKITVFFAAVLPQFVERSRGEVPLQMILLGLTFACIAAVSDSSWGLLASTARRWLAGNPRRLSALGGIGGLTIMGLGVRLALTGRHD